MRAAIDGLLIKYHGAKDLLKQVDADYAAMVQRACTDPNSLLHPTTRQHISRYVKHLAKLKNTSSSLNTSSEKVLETQQLWQSLTTGSQTGESLSRATVEKIVKEILEKQQQQQQKKKMTRNCLACGQPKSRMSFEDFAATPFFERELEAAKQRGAEWKRVAEERKRKSAVQLPTGRLCRFCHQPLKQGPNSPHIHTCFPGVPGKYIYCPSRVFSLYKAQGMVKEMTWMEFQQSDFYEAERDRWAAEKRK
ncbi:hypothetical protein SKAU_G00365000 [Synaphobranchus kaupii]|uniref:Uncharacterized protein n=1 Tax=Synaphobranchus kaupii TaxID=118154 RepID=A0A9Q1EEX6_SYNKA|nr:hypothetical protein SKAU_G00365000 [Synaphobranchus kaupii]